jgi:hypothetical protein
LASEQPPLTSQPRTWAEVVSAPPSLPPQLQAAKYVYVRKGASSSPLSNCYEGPFEVVQHGLKYFRVKIGEKVESVTVDRLKPHTGSLPVSPAQPPQRGRPRKLQPQLISLVAST